MREALIVLWEASDRVCGKRLRPLLPVLVEAMERHGHLQLAPEVRTGVLAMSAATIDRALRDGEGRAAGKRRRRAPPSAAVRRSVPVRTFSDWQDPAPGFFEADLVAHSGPTTRGSYVQTLVLTDIATGWTECAPLLVREQVLLTEVLDEIRKVLPFGLLGFDTDNDSVFMNETVRDYCAAAGVEFTRCRPYRKNDQAFVEQKNGAVVRRIVGYRRLEGLEAAAALGELYRSVRLFVNFFQPSFKLAEKSRDGAVVRKRYHPPATPCQRLLADARVSEDVRDGCGDRSEAGSGSAPAGDPGSPAAARRDRRPIAGWRAAGADGADAGGVPQRAAHGLARGRGAPDGAAEAEGEAGAAAARSVRGGDGAAARVVRAEPWRTSRELLERLQAEVPGAYPEKLLRTLQRRVKQWRGEVARRMVFGTTGRSRGARSPCGNGYGACGNGCGRLRQQLSLGSNPVRQRVSAREHFRMRQYGRLVSAAVMLPPDTWVMVMPV